MAGAIKLVADVAVVAERRVLLVRYRDTRRYDGQAGSAPRVGAGANVDAFEWPTLGALPAASEVAHGGWAVDVLSEIERRREDRV